MGNDRYTLNKDDALIADQYLQRQFLKVDFPTDKKSSNDKYASAFFDVDSSDFKELQDWCDTCLSDQQWGKLRVALRVAHHRKKLTPAKKKRQASFTQEVSQELSDRAIAEGVGLSEMLQLLLAGQSSKPKAATVASQPPKPEPTMEEMQAAAQKMSEFVPKHSWDHLPSHGNHMMFCRHNEIVELLEKATKPMSKKAFPAWFALMNYSIDFARNEAHQLIDEATQKAVEQARRELTEGQELKAHYEKLITPLLDKYPKKDIRIIKSCLAPDMNDPKKVAKFTKAAAAFNNLLDQIT